MSQPLLATKLRVPPQRPGLVPRPHLIRRLDDGLHRKLALISAPAGFGKTTLAAAWVSTLSPAGVAWLSLDQGDDDPARFFTYLLAALQQVDADLGQANLGQAALDLLHGPQTPPPASLVTALINDLAAGDEKLVLVLDDYHTIDHLAIHQAVGFLLDHQPARLHLVITTRHDPPLPLSRLRGRGQITELRQNDLRFTPAETAAFLHQSMGLDLTAAQIATLEERTEGWIAGLQLAALSMQGRDAGDAARFIAGFSGRYQFVLDYLADEVLQRQSPAVQRFLLGTSILDRLCGPLCDAVLVGEPWQTDTSGRQMLLQLHEANLFVVPLDEERRWYRYHALFADLLRMRLGETWPDQLPELHRRASQWYEQEGLTAQAARHALSTGDHDLAAAVVERAIMNIGTWSRLDIAQILDWLQTLPEQAVRGRPWLHLFATRALYTTGQIDEAYRLLDDLDAALQAGPTRPEARKVRELVIADRASYAAVRGDVQQAKEFARQLLDQIAPGDAIGRIRGFALLGMACSRAGDVSAAREAFLQAIAVARDSDLAFTAVPFYCNLAHVHIVCGRLGQAVECCQQAIELGTVGGKPIAPVGFAGLGLGQVHYEQNNLPAAEQRLREGIDILHRGGIAEAFGNMHAVLALVHQARGDEQAARAAIQTGLEFARSSSVQRLALNTAAYQARLWLAQGHLDLAGGWAADYRQVGTTQYLREFEDLTLARVCLALDQAAEALPLLDRLLDPALDAGRLGTVLEAQALRALALQALDRPDPALQALERALDLGQPEGYVRTFVDAGPPMADLLKAAASRGIAPAYVRRLLAALAPPVPASKGEAPPQPLIEPLTDRELEVLALLAEGLTNREIARRLVLSLPTVKSHTRNIYGKLGVHDRRQAVTQARTLGILP